MNVTKDDIFEVARNTEDALLTENGNSIEHAYKLSCLEASAAQMFLEETGQMADYYEWLSEKEMGGIGTF